MPRIWSEAPDERALPVCSAPLFPAMANLTGFVVEFIASSSMHNHEIQSPGSAAWNDLLSFEETPSLCDRYS
jgi:hypothetical protein